MKVIYHISGEWYFLKLNFVLTDISPIDCNKN